MKGTFLILALAASTALAEEPKDKTFQVSSAPETSAEAAYVPNEIKVFIQSDSNKSKDPNYSEQENLKESIDKDIKTNFALLQKDIDNLSNQIEEQEKRIEIQNQHIDHGLNILGIFLGVLGILLTAAGVTSYFTIHSKAEKEAKEAATGWFEKNTENLNRKIDDLQRRLAEIESSAEDLFKSHVEKVKNGAESAMSQMQEFISDRDTPDKQIPKLAEDDKNALNIAANNAAQKPRNVKSFTDWNKLAFNSYAKGDKKAAIGYWNRALKKGTDNEEHTILTLLNIAQTALDLEQHERSLEACEKIVNLTKEQKHTPSLIYLAKAKVIEEINHYAKNNPEEALKCHQQIEEISKSSDSIELQKILNHSSSNVSVYLNEQGRFEEALEKARALLKKLNDNPNAANPEIASRANNSIAFNLICLAKRDWDNKNLRELRLSTAESHAINALLGKPKNRIPEGNLLYCRYLLGASLEETIYKFEQILDAEEEKFYQATLKDLEIHTVPEKDIPLKESLNGIWRLKSGQNGA